MLVMRIWFACSELRCVVCELFSCFVWRSLNLRYGKILRAFLCLVTLISLLVGKYLLRLVWMTYLGVLFVIYLYFHVYFGNL